MRQSFGHYGFEINRKPKKTEFGVLIWRGLTAKRERHLDPLRFGEPLTMAPPLTMAQKRSKVGHIFRLPCSGFATPFRGSDAPKVMPFSDPFLGTALTETCNGLPKNGAIFRTLLLVPRDAESGANEPGICPKFFLSGPVHRNGAVKVPGRRVHGRRRRGPSFLANSRHSRQQKRRRVAQQWAFEKVGCSCPYYKGIILNP